MKCGILASAVCRKPPSSGGGQYGCCAKASRASSPRGALAAVMCGYLRRCNAQLCMTGLMREHTTSLSNDIVGAH